ncbi:hypothetical protein DFQ30_002220, partial [Apophysomyces sp. BC1015]
PARRRNQDFDPTPQFRRLRIHVDAAEHDRAAQRGMRRIRVHVGGHLVRELTRGRQNQRPDWVAGRRCAGARQRQQALDDRQRKARGLAGAGLRRPHDVAPGQHDWNRLRLDRRRLRVALLDYRLQDRRGKAKAVERRGRGCWRRGIGYRGAGSRRVSRNGT